MEIPQIKLPEKFECESCQDGLAPWTKGVCGPITECPKCGKK